MQHTINARKFIKMLYQNDFYHLLSSIQKKNCTHNSHCSFVKAFILYDMRFFKKKEKKNKSKFTYSNLYVNGVKTNKRL